MTFDSLEAVREFAGEDYEQAVVPEKARAVLSHFDQRSQHYEIKADRKETIHRESTNLFHGGVKMNRPDWLRQMRREAEEKYTTLWAPDYVEKWGTYDNTTHQQFIQKFLNLLDPHSIVLDAACGAGRYMPMLLEKGHTVFGIDQSQGMLDSARKRFPDVYLEKIGLQEMSFVEMFDGALCMDAMEHVCPEDWLPIFQNFHRALKSNGCIYFTVEIANADEVTEAFQIAQEMGLPVVYGEWVNDEVYHYYPSMNQVREWMREAGFRPVEEGEGDSYRHFIIQKI
jgi:SAM-dependent methyltransferase